MGILNRQYFGAGGDEPPDDRYPDSGYDKPDDDIPSWEMMSDELRKRLHDLVKNCPVSSLGELAVLIGTAEKLQVFHIRGLQLDKEGAKEEGDE